MLAKIFQDGLNLYNDIALLRIKQGADTLMKIPPGTSFQDNILILNSDKNIDKLNKMSFAGWGYTNENSSEVKISMEILN